MWKDAHWAYLRLHLRHAQRRPRPAAARRRRSPTSSATSSWGSSRRPTSTATRTRTSTTSRTTTCPTAGSRPARATSARRTTRRTRRSRSAAQLMGGERRPTFVALRPRLRAAVVRGQREQGARRRRAPGARAERQLPQGRERSRHDCTGRHARQGVLGRRHGADLHQPGRARPGGRQHAAGPGRELRGGPQPDHRGFQNLTDPDNPGKQVVLKVMKKEELRNVDGTDALHPNRSGDVVVVLRPPYQTDAADAGPADRALAVLRPARLPAGPGRPGRTTSTCTGRSSPRARASRSRSRSPGVRAIDVAPTLAFLMGIPGPQNARGKILYEPDDGRRDLQGDHHPQHQRLARPARAAGRGVRQPGRRRVGNPAFPIGGSAFLKPWFDVYRAEAAGQVDHDRRAATRSARTPPISTLLRGQADDRVHEP